MSGHSKWSQIKRAKGVNDQKRGQLFTKLGREITVSARAGGSNPDGNARLRLAIERAREANMAMETVQRAIQRGAGAGEGVQLDEVAYEAYGPGGAGLLIEATTDNRNRTVAEVRATLSRNGGSMGESGSVAWNFESRGILLAEPKKGEDAEDLALRAIDGGADDFSVDDGELEVLVEPARLEEVRQVLEEAGAALHNIEVAMVPRAQIDLPADQTAQVLRLIEKLEDLDDVSRVYTNVRISEEALSQVGA